MSVSYIGAAKKAGRPKKLVEYGDLHCKRVALGAQESSDQLTGLFLLWSKKQISYEQFVAGCYYEELVHRVRRSMGALSGPKNSSLSRVHEAHLNEVTKKMASFNMNEAVSDTLAKLQEVIGYVHTDALRLTTRILQADGMESAAEISKLNAQQLSLFKYVLDVINRYLAANSVEVQQQVVSIA